MSMPVFILAAMAVLHVSPGGDDAGTGTVDAPLRTLAAAAARARATRGARIILADGVYETDVPFVLTTDDRRLVFEAAPGARPVVSAGMRISGWTVDANGWWRARVPAGLRFAQFYVDGQRRLRPFLPRRGYYFVDRGAGAEPGAGRERFYCRQSDFPSGENPDLEVCVFHIWSITRAKVAAYDSTSRRVTMDSRHLTCDYEAMNPDRWYRFDNVRTALGEPGDWYLDPVCGEIVYVPLPGETPERCATVAARHHHAVRIDGAEDVTFRGLTFAYAEYGVQAGGNHIAQAAADQPGAVHAENARRIRLENCAIAHTGAYGAVFTRGCERCDVVGCELFDLGAGGVRIGDFWEKTRKPVISRDCTVEDCLMEGGGRVDPAGVGVLVGHGAGTRIAHNTIHDLYYSGVSVGWNWAIVETARDNVIEWNHIYDIGKNVLADMGGIYLLGSQPGTVERFNHIHHVSRGRTCGFGVYFDSGTSFVTVTNNIVHDCESANFFCAQISASNRVENNVFAFSPISQISNPPRTPPPAFASLFARNIVLCGEGERLFLETPQPDERTMVYRDNIVWRCGAEALPGQRGFSVRDPGFADPAARDFRFRDDDAAKSIGFVPFSIDGCGRRASLRFAPSAKPTPDVFYAAPDMPAYDLNENFERLFVGESWPRWSVFPGDCAKCACVTDSTAAEGSQSLEVVDSRGDWTPHLYLNVTRKQPGVCRISFSLKVEPGARPEFEVRESHGVWQSAPGPKVDVSADGWLCARGRRLVKVPHGEWFTVGLEFGLGPSRKEDAYSVLVTLPGDAAPREFRGNPLHKRFRSVHWLGFQSLASGGVRYWIDDFRVN